MEMPLTVAVAPAFIFFELIHLLVAEKYVGIRQIRAGTHPIICPAPFPGWVSLLWLLFVLAQWPYVGLLALLPMTALHGIIIGSVSLVCFGVRRALGLSWILVVLTIEGAIRMGLLANLYFTFMVAGSPF